MSDQWTPDEIAKILEHNFEHHTVTNISRTIGLKESVKAMREYLKIPVRVEAVQAREIIASPEDDWSTLPSWVREIYACGQMVIAGDGVTLLQVPEDAKARPEDYIARDSLGVVAVYDEGTFEREFVNSEPPTDCESCEVPEPDTGIVTSRHANPCYWSPEQLRLYCVELTLPMTGPTDVTRHAEELYRYIIDGPKGVDATAVAA